MEKILLNPDTWGYKNFINDQEQTILKDYAYKCVSRLNGNGHGRYFASINTWGDLPQLIFDLFKRIIKTENITKFYEEKNFGHFLSFNFEGGSIHPHKDPNNKNCIHTRYNLLLSLPKSGGNPIYDGNVLEVEEKMIWRCEAGKYTHESTPVVGQVPRINLSFGFQLPVDFK